MAEKKGKHVGTSKTIPNPPNAVKDNPKTSGIMMRGYGAATKGRMVRGPLG
jgi:hypothetical protein